LPARTPLLSFFWMTPLRRRSTLFPYTTLFRSFNWDAAIAQNTFQTCGIYFGSQFLHKSLDCGKNWEIISPDLTTNDTLKQRLSKDRKSTRLNSSHVKISYAVFCLKKKSPPTQL